MEILHEKEREVMSEILEVYQSKRFLWDPSSNNYFNKDARTQAYGQILELYKVIKPAATIKDVKRKLDNMRTTFKKELKKVKESIVTGQGAKGEYVPTLWYFEQMKFVDDNNVRRAGRETIEEIIIAEDVEIKEEVDEPHTLQVFNPQFYTQESEEFNSPLPRIMTPQPTPSPSSAPPKNKMKHNTYQKRQQQLLELANSLKNTEEEESVFARSIAQQFKTIEPLQLTIARKLFSDTIFHAQMGQLTPTSSISLQSFPSSSLCAPISVHPSITPFSSTPSCSASPTISCKSEEL